MARILSRLLLRPCTPLHSPSLAIKSPPLIIPLSFHHRHSSFKPQLIEINLASSSSSSSPSSSSMDGGGGREEEEALLIQKLEEIIHRVMLQKSTPDWLPFIPGSSFWVPPHKQPLSLSELAEKLANRLSDEESLALTTSRGWPCSSFFIPTQEINVVNVEERVDVKVKVLEEGDEVDGKVAGRVLADSALKDGEVTVQVLDSEGEEVGVQVLEGSHCEEGEVAVEVLVDSVSEDVEKGVQVLDSQDGKLGGQESTILEIELKMMEDEIQKLKDENQKLKDIINSLESDMVRLCAQIQSLTATKHPEVAVKHSESYDEVSLKAIGDNKPRRRWTMYLDHVIDSRGGEGSGGKWQ